MNWFSKPLSEILEQSGQHRAGDKDLPVLSITMKQGLVDQSDKFKKRVASADTSSYRVAYKNELVVGFPIDEGVLGFQTKYPAGIVSPAYAIWKLKSGVQCHIPYLERYLRSSEARRLYARRMQGAVARRRSLTKGDFLELEIPFPVIDDQIRIDLLLGKLERLISERTQHLQQLDDLIKSIFLEMFGDPVRNERGWDKPELKRFGKVSTGNTPPRNDSANYNENFIEWIKTDNINSDAMFVTASVEHLSETGSRRARTVSSGALLVACIAGSVESIGRAALADRAVSFNQQINAIQPADDVNPLYLYGLFKLSRPYIQSYATKGMKKILTKGDFEQITMIKPPIELQDLFATIVEKVEGLKLKYRQSFTDLQALYGALSQQAFKGELDLSRIPLLAMPIEGENAVTTVSVPEPTAASVIDLPDTDLLLAALESRSSLKQLLHEWLEFYCGQLDTATFSIEDFVNAVQDKAAEMFPDKDLELGQEAYEHIKSWVFDALADGRLRQSRDITGQEESGKPVFGNLIEIRQGAEL
ncbi:restriction endonuclease subunit S [Dyella marensis]|uniref:restriction endonuclease subunit S n=1 Tax=Dyella marensis TaxID=500610 RepID=UPI0031D63DC4